MQPQRHSLVWLTAPGWDQVQASAAGKPVLLREALARWRAADWPLVVRRRLPPLAATELALGIALPPQPQTGVRPRIASVVDQRHVRRIEPPLLLSAILTVAPVHWRAALSALLLEALDGLPPLQVYGSLAWQTITGMQYLTSVSDIDLLVTPASRSQLDACLDCLRRHAEVLPLDGEIVFPDGAAVSWKEWSGVIRGNSSAASAKVLVKHVDSVAMSDCGALLATFDGAVAS